MAFDLLDQDAWPRRRVRVPHGTVVGSAVCVLETGDMRIIVAHGVDYYDEREPSYAEWHAFNRGQVTARD